MATVWLPLPGMVKNLVNLSNVADRNATVDVAALYPGLVPINATSLILTVERGYSQTPTGAHVVSLRVMPNGRDLNNMLDRAKAQVAMGGVIPGVDVVAQDVRMPIYAGVQKFFYALQSSDSAVANKMIIIDLWGYET